MSELFNLHDRKFRALRNVDNGDVSKETLFHYRQKDKIIWATYEGGSVLFGTLSGKIEGNRLTFNYQHQNTSGELMTGFCTSEIKIEKGIIRLHETWQWTCGDRSKGTSVLEEI